MQRCLVKSAVITGYRNPRRPSNSRVLSHEELDRHIAAGLNPCRNPDHDLHQAGNCARSRTGVQHSRPDASDFDVDRQNWPRIRFENRGDVPVALRRVIKTFTGGVKRN